MKTISELIASCLFYSLILILASLIVIIVFIQEPNRILFFLTYGLLIEGGLAMATGGVLASFSPLIGKIDETFHHTKTLDGKRLKETERVATLWILTGIFLFIFGLLVSTL